MADDNESEADRLAREGIAAAAKRAGAAWRAATTEAAMVYALRHDFFTSEDVKLDNIGNPELKPHHPNAWGSRPRTWVRIGFCEFTGIIVRGRTAASHGHKLHKLKSLIFEPVDK